MMHLEADIIHYLELLILWRVAGVNPHNFHFFELCDEETDADIDTQYRTTPDSCWVQTKDLLVMRHANHCTISISVYYNIQLKA